MPEGHRRIGESKSSAGLRPGGIANQEEGEEAEGGDMGSEGGGRDLNLGTPEPVLSAIRSPRPLLTADEEVVVVEWRSEVRRLVKEEEDMNEKEFAEVGEGAVITEKKKCVLCVRNGEDDWRTN